MRTRLSLLALLVGALFLAGCGASGGGSDAPLSSEPSETASAPGSEPTGGPTVSGKPVPGGAGITITGTPTEGVENGCVVMQSGDTLYLLLGGDQTLLTSGRPVAVTGQPNPGLMTTCQQGTPFQVTAVRAA
jgi:hypothetical protein